MLKKYLFFFSLQVFAIALWAFWVLPDVGETGEFSQTAAWLAVQVLFPVFFSLLIARRRKSGYWLTALYGVIIGLYALGMTGWALVGAGTPVSVYAVCAIFFVVAFGVVFNALKDLNIGQKQRRYDEIKDE